MEKYNNCHIKNLVFSAENEGLSNARQVVFTYSSRACVHRISVLLDLAVKVKLFHWRWTSVMTWCSKITGVIRDCNWSDSADVNNDLQGHRSILLCIILASVMFALTLGIFKLLMYYQYQQQHNIMVQ